MAVRSHERQSAQMRKKAENEKLKIKRAIQQNNPQGAQVYAENAIRDQNMSQFYLRMASRLEGIINKLEIYQGTQDIINSLDQANKALQGAMGNADLKKINNVLSEFEKRMGILDVVPSILIPDQVGNPEVDNLVSEMAAQLNIQPNPVQPLPLPLPVIQNIAPPEIQYVPDPNSNQQQLLAFNNDVPQPIYKPEPQLKINVGLAQIISFPQIPQQQPQPITTEYVAPIPSYQYPPIPNVQQRNIIPIAKPVLPLPSYPSIHTQPQYQVPDEPAHTVITPPQGQSPVPVEAPTLQQQIRSNRRTIERTIAEIDRAIQQMQAEEKKQINEVKKALKAQQPTSAKIMAKNIVRIRANIQRMYSMRANMVGLLLRILTVGSQQKMMECLKSVGAVLRGMNKDMKDANYNQVVNQFLKDNEELNFQMDDFDLLADNLFPEEEPGESDEIVYKIIVEIQIEGKQV